MIKKKLFQNDSYTRVLWWNRTGKILSVGLFDKNNLLIQKSSIYPLNYLIVPAGGTVKLLLDSD